MKGEEMDKNEKLDNQEKVLEDAKRRAFLDKFGKLSATVPVGMLVLMGPTQSKADGSSTNDGGD